MEFRKIGKLDVSVIGLGCNQFGTAFCDEATTTQVVNEAIDAGITYFDTADEYGSNYFNHDDPDGWGRSEEFLGRALRGRRDKVIIGSKFSSRPHGEPDAGGASARWARIAVEASLKRLNVDHIDLYQQHFPDPKVPIEETLGVLAEFIEEGKVLEIGCSNFSAEQLDQASTAAQTLGVRRFASNEGPLNILQRANLAEVLPACERLDMAFIPYYPLASGMLTGKYRRGQELPPVGRLTEQLDDAAQAKIFSDRGFARIEALEAFATERGHTLLELAFAWLLGYPNVATVIAGAARPGQASANAAVAGWHLSPEDVSEVIRVVTESAP